MKIKSSLLLVVLQWILLIAPAQSKFLAGAAQVNITPALGTTINGEFIPYYVKQIHDSIHAKALAFSSGKERVVFVVVDCMAIDKEFIDAVKRTLQKKTGLLPGQVLISSTHAHSCGAITPDLFCPPDLNYRAYLPGRIVLSVQQALKNLRPAIIAWGKANVPQHVSCRRWFMKEGFDIPSPFGGQDKVRMNPPQGNSYIDRPADTTDPSVGYLAVKGTGGQWISLLANYSVHYVGDFPSNTISADFFGETAEQFRKKLDAGAAFVGIMSNGTSGDVNAVDFKNEKKYPTGIFEKTKLIANDITDSVIASFTRLTWENNPVLHTAYQEMNFAVRKPSLNELGSANKSFQAAEYSPLKEPSWASKELFDIYAFHQLKLAHFPDRVALPVQVVRIGNGAIGALPGEFFASTGLLLKKKAPYKNYFTICLANGYVGYVPPPEQMALGGYETWRSLYSYLEIQAVPKFINGITGLIKRVQ